MNNTPSIPANRVMRGTFGYVQVDGVTIAEISAFQSKVNVNKDKVHMAGTMAVDTRPTSTEGNGSMTVKKVYSRFYDYLASVQRGEDPRCVVIGGLDDPGAYGAERVAHYGCSFDSYTLADWKVGSIIEETLPFTFTSSELLDKVVPK